jgi:hypothetical protein
VRVKLCAHENLHAIVSRFSGDWRAEGVPPHNLHLEEDAQVLPRVLSSGRGRERVAIEMGKRYEATIRSIRPRAGRRPRIDGQRRKLTPIYVFLRIEHCSQKADRRKSGGKSDISKSLSQATFSHGYWLKSDGEKQAAT